MATQRLPTVNSDDGQWGTILNHYLEKEHYNTGIDDAANGGHKTVTIRAGTATAGTAPLKLTSGTVLSAPEAGAMEFTTDSLFFTITAGTARKTIAWTDMSNVSTIALTVAATTTDAITVKVTGDANQRIIINGDGSHEWGDGTAAVDTNLYRSAANTLKTDDNFVIGINGAKTTLNLSDTTASVGLTIGGDVNLFRSAANKLATDDELFAMTNNQVVTRADLTPSFLLMGG